MGRPEGSRVHEHALRAAVSSLDLDGWRLLRVRNLTIPLVAIKDGKIRVAGHAAWDWVRDPAASYGDDENPRSQAKVALQADADEYLTLGREDDFFELRGSDLKPLQSSIMAAFDVAAEKWQAAGWRVVKHYSMNPSGYLRIIQPDGIASRANELWAIEATCESPVRRIRPYGMYDGVVVARFKSGTVLHADLLPNIVIEFWKGGEVVHSTRSKS